jgi:hypothetical protein
MTKTAKIKPLTEDEIIGVILRIPIMHDVPYSFLYTIVGKYIQDELIARANHS